jgi:hypothetical protein
MNELCAAPYSVSWDLPPGRKGSVQVRALPRTQTALATPSSARAWGLNLCPEERDDSSIVSLHCHHD